MRFIRESEMRFVIVASFTEEAPPPYTPRPNATVACRVCRNALTLKPGVNVITCNSCGEATVSISYICNLYYL